MIAKMRMGPKGQVVIPKHFREDLGLRPGGEVVLDYSGKDITIRKPQADVAKMLLAVAKSGKKVKVTTELLKRLDEEELEDRHGSIHR